MSNATCFTQHAPFEGPPLIQDGELKFQAHHVGWIITFTFTLVATLTSFWLIIKHLRWYTQKRQQRYIIRLLLMVPIYATVSLASYIFWNHAIPITLARDSYEALVLYSFFYLLLQYLSPTVEGQKEVFRNVTLKKWVFPMGFVKYRPEDGLYFLQLMKWGVLQYCVIRPTTTLAAVILDTIGLYCEDSWSPGWGHIYITIIVSVSVTIAMYCLIQLYIPISEQLAQHKPLLKLFSVKAVVFLTFWQATGLSVLTMFGVVKDTNYMTAEDINTGIAAILETFEMMCFAFLHIRAFSYHPYRAGKKLTDRTPRFRSLFHALDFRDMWREIWAGSIYMGRTMRGVEAEAEARKRIHFARVMGRERELLGVKEPKHTWDAEETREEDLLLNDGRGHERRNLWLSDQGDRFGGAFEDEVQGELRQRGLDKDYRHHVDFGLERVEQGHKRGQGSWWRGVYDRFRLGDSDHANGDQLSPLPQRSPHIHSDEYLRRDSRLPSLDSPPPPPSVMYEYAVPGAGRSSVRLSRSHQRTANVWCGHDADDALLGHHYSHLRKDRLGPVAGPAGSLRSDESPSKGLPPLKVIAAPRPLSASNVQSVEILISRDERIHPETELSSIPMHNQNNIPAPSGVLRSDSILGRIFPNSTVDTVDGHGSSDGRSNPTSSQDTLSTGLMFPAAMASPSANFTSPIRGKSAEPFSPPVLSSPSGLHSSAHAPSFTHHREEQRRSTHLPLRHGHPRPEIVLPTPLAPARHPKEFSRHDHSHLQDARNGSSQRELAQNLSSMQPSRDTQPSRARGPQRHGNSQRHSTQTEQPLPRHQRVKKRKTNPKDPNSEPPFSTASRGARLLHHSPLNDEDNAISQLRLTSNIYPSKLPSPQNGSGSASSFTTPPSVSPSSRILRHARDDISKARRPWS